MMKRILVFILIAASILAQSAPLSAVTKPAKQEKTENLTYDVYFHLGFIWAKAGRGNLTYYNEVLPDGTQLKHGQLAAQSLNVVEHIMKVRDTLDTWMNNQMIPTEFIKKTHEGKYNCIEHNIFTPKWKDTAAKLDSKNVASSEVKVHRWLQKGKERPSTDDTLHIVNEPAYDMLSLFYVVRDMDFSTMKKNTKMKYACFSGLKKDWINVEYKGVEQIELRNEKKFTAHLVYLTFATKGQESTPLKVWLSQTPDHRPLKVIIGLKRIGSVQCEIVE